MHSKLHIIYCTHRDVKQVLKFCWQELQNIMDFGSKNGHRSNHRASNLTIFLGDMPPDLQDITYCICRLWPYHLEIACYSPALGQGTLLYTQSHIWAGYVSLRTITHLGRVRFSTYNHTFGQGTFLYVQSHTWAGYVSLRTITHLGRVW